ncbi:efflux transporter outer membrane subunit [Achromobacter seleniivolatilans]|uniref:Efflux transporter outer membrane subunit n=1 Tax=Achromobacter seleniivolatilans TaxID=3047478 RepID=A0ABY9LUG0_9BURK|nr:efflux transporter outer membrane subunit [Achromobacter sp. R39]WMD18416.1 efflux transporter outer membrane subunit [Achromobacter sp. R39]
MKAVSFICKPAALALLLALGGCGSLLRSDYEPPLTEAPAAWKYAAPGNAMAPLADGGAWWRNFNDPVLDGLIDAVLARNNDLAAAAIRVRRAQYQAGLSEDKLIPQLGGDANVTRNRSLYGDRAIARTNAAELTVSYEVDLWGKLSRQRDAAQWEALATEQDRQSAALSLVGTTATLYWQTAFINQRIASSEESIAYARKTQDLVRAQYAAGGASALELAEAEQTVASQQAAHTLLVQQRVEYTNALTILFDGPPDRSMADPARLPSYPMPEARAGVPAELLGRRPDLRAAELRLRESLATVDATRASFYPPVTLTGALGSSSPTLSNVLQNPIASLGVGLTLPFLQWTQMQLNIKISKADYEERVVNFRQALYQAMADVENALSNRTQLTLQAEQLDLSLRAAREAERLYEVRYRAGAVSLKDWLDAQEKRRTAEIARDENGLNRLVNQVTVYRALGGDDQVAGGA